MAWDKGFNFRDDLNYVTDGTNETYVVLADTYPQTRNGVTFGWVSGLTGVVDRDSGIDRRLAGVNYRDNTGTQAIFRVDLPNAGTYSIRIALGDAGFTHADQYAQIRDGATARITVDDTDGTLIDHWDDAAGNDHTVGTWPGTNTAVDAVFTGTILNLAIGTTSSQSNSSTIAHMFISETASAALTGTVTASITESDIQAGGKTIVLTLSGTTWVA